MKYKDNVIRKKNNYKKLLISIGLALLIFEILNILVGKENLVKTNTNSSETYINDQIMGLGSVGEKQQYVREENQLVIKNLNKGNIIVDGRDIKKCNLTTREGEVLK